MISTADDDDLDGLRASAKVRGTLRETQTHLAEHSWRHGESDVRPGLR